MINNGTIAIAPPASQTNPLPCIWPSPRVIPTLWCQPKKSPLTHHLIAPQSTIVFACNAKEDIPLVAPANYSPANPFIIGSPSSVSLRSLSQNMSKHTISSQQQSVVKPVLIVEGNEGKQVSGISVVTPTGWVYKSKDIADAEERKRNGKTCWLKSQKKGKRLARMKMWNLSSRSREVNTQ